jgi:hypothetical protein
MRRTIIFIIALIMVATAASTASAQRKYGVNKTITFKPGVSKMRIVGRSGPVLRSMNITSVSRRVTRCRSI